MLKKGSLIFIVLLLCCGCGPSVKVQRFRSAEVDMSGLRRLAFAEFDYYNSNVDSIEDIVVGAIASQMGLRYGDDIERRNIASYATSAMFEALEETRYFSVIDLTSMDTGASRPVNEDLERARQFAADALFAGRIEAAECEREIFEKIGKVYDKKKKSHTSAMIPWLRQDCELTLSYKVVRVVDNQLIERKRFTERLSEEIEEKNEYHLTREEQWLEESVDKIIPQISRRLAPYHDYVKRSLKVDGMDDTEMKLAIRLAEQGQLDSARTLFLRRWHQTSNPAAGFNAALLSEARGNFAEAAALLSDIMRITNDRAVAREYEFVQELIREQEEAFRQSRR